MERGKYSERGEQDMETLRLFLQIDFQGRVTAQMNRDPTLEEIAQLLDMTPANVARVAQRAKTRLRELCEKENVI